MCVVCVWSPSKYLTPTEGRILIRDCSVLPTVEISDLERGIPLDGFLKNSPNQGLRSGASQGFSYLSDLNCGRRGRGNSSERVARLRLPYGKEV